MEPGHMGAVAWYWLRVRDLGQCLPYLCVGVRDGVVHQHHDQDRDGDPKVSNDAPSLWSDHGSRDELDPSRTWISMVPSRERLDVFGGRGAAARSAAQVSAANK